jgi:hypothetical protein
MCQGRIKEGRARGSDDKGGAGVIGVAGGEAPGPWVPPFKRRRSLWNLGIRRRAPGKDGLRANGFSRYGVAGSWKDAGVDAQGADGLRANGLSRTLS